MTPDSIFVDAEWIEVADAIGARLCRDALWCEDGCFWLGSIPVPGGHRRLASLGSTLYSGTAGIGLFLAALADATSDPTYARYADGALRFAHRDPSREAVGPGFYQGATGLAYAFIVGGRLLGADLWTDRGLQALRALPPKPGPGTRADVMEGSAGAILALHYAYEACGLACADLVDSYARALIEEGRTSAEGVSWSPGRQGMMHLLGYSHGTAGIADALNRAATMLNDRSIAAAAAAAMRYENAFFDPARNNWPDFRLASRPEDGEFMTAWCHGAPGIAVSRMLLTPPSPDLAPALLTTLQSLSRLEDQHDFCLCHGVCGNADVVLSAWRLSGEKPLLDAVLSVAAYGREVFHRAESDWPLGGSIEYRQLMTGVAGIGYFYLRLASRGRLESVLFPSISPDLPLAPESARSQDVASGRLPDPVSKA